MLLLRRPGHHALRGADLMILPVIDCDKTYALELKNEENVMQAPYFTIQCALLYSTSFGERRIRVHTTQVRLTSGHKQLRHDRGSIVFQLS